jgi:uncharacterized membrane protein YhaH (DUF805 family)
MSETEISCAEAREKHGVTCKHSLMPNGELRFRLLKSDGTAYIRTESPPKGDWQNSHYHNKVKETYIVQAGWIGYAELFDGKPMFRIYHEGESFTTKPSVIHNVYMPAGAVIHTVKHGGSSGEKRLEDERTDHFTAVTKNISEAELERQSSLLRQPPTTEATRTLDDYNEAYRHFDNLIWQVAAWSSGIFTVAIGGASQLTSSNPVITMTGLSFQALTSFLFAIFGVFILVLSHALYCFRWHQIRVKNYIPRTHLLSPQVGLQSIVNIQAVILASLPPLLLGVSITVTAVIAATVLIAMAILQEVELIRVGKEGNKPRDIRS